jgi:alpha,alpha-trehalose phosphorylase
MIDHSAFEVDPWRLRECRLDLDLMPHTESLFALSNGHIGWRGTLDEGEPHHLPGTYLNGVYELRPLPYAEAGYGYPESGQTVINVTNGRLIRLLVDDEPFDVRYGQLLSHERELDLRDGVLRRSVEWRSPAGRTVRVRSTRIVSLTQRSVCAVRYEVEPVDGPARIVVQSELTANEEMPAHGGDPRAAAALENPLVGDLHVEHDTRVTLVHTVRNSGLRVAAAMEHIVESPDGLQAATLSEPDLGRFGMAVVLQPGEVLRVTKFVAYGWSSERSLPAMRDQVEGALSAARRDGWDRLCADQRDDLAQYWARADVEIDHDPRIQQAVRFALFQIYQSAARAEQRAIPAKGLTGNGYDGHAFWDTEMFVLSVLTYTDPDSVANALRWRHSTLAAARERAGQLGLEGAAFPWRTIAGHECSAYWPAGTAAFHVNADIADAVVRYHVTAGDEQFEQEYGVELLVETARLWWSVGHMDDIGEFRIEGVTGPDEYSALADNNVYTNLMARQNLRAAAASVEQYPEVAERLGIRPEEVGHWRAAADSMYVPYDAKRGVHPQADGFTDHAEWDFAGMTQQDYPLLLRHSYFQLYRRQVVKQADLVLALYTCGDAFSDEEKARNFDYYERITVRDSSLSACSQAVVAAEVGCLELAYDYLAEAALMDLDDLENNTTDGLHLASLAGSWIALVAGFGGMRRGVDGMRFAPRLPESWERLSFKVVLNGHVLRVDVRRDEATYTLDGPDPLEFRHHGQAVTLHPDRPLDLPIPPREPREAPAQPPGRAPAHCLTRPAEPEPDGPSGDEPASDEH